MSNTKTVPHFLRAADLFERQIASNRSQIDNLVRNHGFPAGRLISPNVRAWTEEEIAEYLDRCPTEPRETNRGPGRPRRRTTEAA